MTELLTCESIATRARELALGMPITRENYRAVAERIHPPVPKPKFSKALDYDPNDYPEWGEYRRGSHYHTDDWLDMVVSCITMWQWRVRVARIVEQQQTA